MSKFFIQDDLSQDQIFKIEKELTIILKDKPFSVFLIRERKISLPFFYGTTFISNYTNKFDFANKTKKQSSNVVFKGNLNLEQIDIKDQAFKILETKKSIIIKAQPGFGKTIISINILSSFNFPWVIVVKQTLVSQQWLDSINKFISNLSNVKITTCWEENADIYIINPLLLSRSNIFRCVNIVIVDELHTILSEKLHTGLFRINTNYLIGLSATPYRTDIFQNTIDMFFGNFQIGKKMHHFHYYKILHTSFNPALKFTSQGRVDWNYILTLQSQDLDRNEIIISVLKKYPEKNWLILVKRIVHAEILQEKIANIFSSENVELLIKQKRKFNKNVKILIGTTSKIGVGFDHAKIDALIVAADIVAYFQQFIGRCMRNPEITPLIIDFCDKQPILRKHFYKRLQEYKNCGGVQIM